VLLNCNWQRSFGVSFAAGPPVESLPSSRRIDWKLAEIELAGKKYLVLLSCSLIVNPKRPPVVANRHFLFGPAHPTMLICVGLEVQGRGSSKRSDSLHEAPSSEIVCYAC
jgi:hypothetical protein